MSRTVGGLTCVRGEHVGCGGRDPLIVTENGAGPALPAELVAVTLNTVVPATVGNPENPPSDASVAQDGRPVPVQVIGVVPLAVKL